MTATAQEFIDAMYGNFEDGWLTLFSIDKAGNRRTDWFTVDQLTDMVNKAVNMVDRNVWFGVATRRAALDDGQRGGKHDCLALPAMYCDIDIAGPNHKDSTGLPTSVEEAMALIDRFPLRPSCVVFSGGGLHPYWFLQEPSEAAEASILLERWSETWQQIATKMHLRIDNVFDLPRVLRVPDTINQKNGAVVKILDLRHVRYGVDDIMESTVDPPVRQMRNPRTTSPIVGTRPGDVFNQRHDAGYVLSQAGWKPAGSDHNGNDRWLHPWQPSSDCSATVYADDGHCTIWSDTVPVHCPAITVRTPYDPYGLYVRLNHNGDFAEATKALLREGNYGERVDVTLVTMPNGKCRPKKRIQVGARQLDDIANEVVDGLVELNDPPQLFTYGDTVSRFERDQLVPVDRVGLLHIVESSLQPVKRNKDGVDIPSRVEQAALDIGLYRMLIDLPRIEGIARSPFLRADGTVCMEAGFDETSAMYLARSLAVNVPDTPNADDLRRAVALIDEMIVDFPLETASDRAHVFALLLTLVTRHLVPLVPLFAFDGTGPGVGKNLLSECCAYVATGEWAQTDPLPLDAEEQRKQITAMLSTGRSVALFDEAHIITGVSLARLITSQTWGDRLLGYSKQVSYPNKITVIALGNNVEVQGDMPRRTILIRLASNLSRPELRDGFLHDDLRGWVEANRAKLLGAALTILRAWATFNKPKGSARLGSFDQWAQMIGGALEVAGVDGFLANVDTMRERGATDDGDMEDHVHELRAWFDDRTFTTGEVADLLASAGIETWPPKVAMTGNRVSQQIGYAYRRSSDRWYGDLMLVNAGRGHGNVKKWAVLTRAEVNAESGEPTTNTITPNAQGDETNTVGEAGEQQFENQTVTSSTLSGQNITQSPPHSQTVRIVRDAYHEKPLLSGGDGGDGGDVQAEKRRKTGKQGPEDAVGAERRKASPPSPPSPPLAEQVADPSDDIAAKIRSGELAPF